MSVIYECDFCKNTIAPAKNRVVIQGLIVSTDYKETWHSCRHCFENYLKPALAGAFLPKKVEDEAEEPVAVEEVPAPAPVEETPVKVAAETPVATEEPAPAVEESASVDVEYTGKEISEQPLEIPMFDTPQLSRRSKYFSPEICHDIHRFFLLNTKPKILADRYGIPYQLVLNYSKTVKFDNVEYTPKNTIELLEKISEEHSRRIPEIKALLATGTWSRKAVADELGLDQFIVDTVWEDLPWFCL